MKRINKYPKVNSSQEDAADQVIENDPAFKERIEKAFAEYKANGGMEVSSLINNFRKSLVKPAIKD